MATLLVVCATWCQPCQQLKARLRAAGIPFRVADVESAPGRRLSDDLGVASIPAVFVKSDGEYIRVLNPTLTSIRAALERHEERECGRYG